MDSNLVNSTLPNFFFKPLIELYLLSDCRYKCHSLADLEYAQLGIERCISSASSGTDFLQHYQKEDGSSVEVGHFFEALKSNRRLQNLSSLNQCLRPYMRDYLNDPLSEISELKKWHFYAADGHYHKAALFDPKTKADLSKKEPTKSPTGHFFRMDLRTHHLGYLDLAQPEDGKKSEHDMKVLKRQCFEELKNGARKGEKVFYFWDRASIDFEFWKNAKHQAGIYFATLAKSNTSTTKIRDLNILDYSDHRNEGIQYDRLVRTSKGYEIREILYKNPADGVEYKYLTSEMSLDAWVIVLLYKHRWDIEKVFDELKTKCGEKQAWASSTEAKKSHATFLCLTHNLMVLSEDHLKTVEGLDDEVEKKKSLIRKRPSHPPKKKLHISFINGFFKRPTQRTCRFIRWLRNALNKRLPYVEALAQITIFWKSNKV